MATRNGTAKWTGDLKTGSGELTVGERAWTAAYSGSSRLHGVLPGFEEGPGPIPRNSSPRPTQPASTWRSAMP